jgi:hypothetical protein
VVSCIGDSGQPLPEYVFPWHTSTKKEKFGFAGRWAAGTGALPAPILFYLLDADGHPTVLPFYRTGKPM